MLIKSCDIVVTCIIGTKAMQSVMQPQDLLDISTFAIFSLSDACHLGSLPVHYSAALVNLRLNLVSIFALF